MQQTPNGWNANDVQRFNALIDTCFAYMVFDYARTKVAPANAFLQQRQQDVGALVLSLGQDFINQFGQ